MRKGERKGEMGRWREIYTLLWRAGCITRNGWTTGGRVVRADNATDSVFITLLSVTRYRYPLRQIGGNSHANVCGLGDPDWGGYSNGCMSSGVTFSGMKCRNSKRRILLHTDSEIDTKKVLP